MQRLYILNFHQLFPYTEDVAFNISYWVLSKGIHLSTLYHLYNDSSTLDTDASTLIINTIILFHC